MKEILKKIDYRNKTKRLPICFCIDNSASMNIIIEGNQYTSQTGQTEYADGETTNIVEINEGYEHLVKTKNDCIYEGMKILYEEVKNNEDACESCESITISFNDTVEILDEFSETASKDTFQLNVPCGNTNFSEAVRKALECLDERVNVYKNNHIKYCIPWLVIFTDGVATDDITDVRTEILNREINRKLIIMPFCVSNIPDEIEKVRRLSSRNFYEYSDVSNPDKIRKAFEFLIKSISSTSKSGKFNYNGYDAPNGIPEGF